MLSNNNGLLIDNLEDVSRTLADLVPSRAYRPRDILGGIGEMIDQA